MERFSHIKFQSLERCEESFKQVQSAYSLIGDEHARKSYDRGSTLFSGDRGYDSSRFPRHQFKDPYVDEFYRAFAAAAAANPSPDEFRFGKTNNSFFRFTPNDMFSRNKSKYASFWNKGSLKSTYVQKIEVPLQELYIGRTSMEFTVKDSAWKSYSAAFRGGIGYFLLYQSLIFAAPLLRISRLLTLAFSAFVFHTHVPRPTTFQFTADILPGYKEGTKIIFRNAEPGFDMVFILKEEKHERFTRIGNDLYTTVIILASQAKEGCTVEIESLDPLEQPTILKLRRYQIKQSGETITVNGKGWPNRKDKHGRRGDLIVTFKIARKLPRPKHKSKESA